MRYTPIILVLSLLFISTITFPAVKADTQINAFVHMQQWGTSLSFGGQEGIAADDHWHFFLADSKPTSDDGNYAIHVAVLDNTTHNFTSSSINGISGLDVPYHVSDIFCDDNYLFVPWSDWPTQSQAKCYV